MKIDVGARVAAGTVELGWAARAATRDPRADSLALIGAVALGLRNLSQAAFVARRPSRPVRRVSAAIDGLHAASMLVAAHRAPALRGPCSTSAAMGSLLAATSWWAAGRRA